MLRPRHGIPSSNLNFTLEIVIFRSVPRFQININSALSEPLSEHGVVSVAPVECIDGHRRLFRG